MEIVVAAIAVPQNDSELGLGPVKYDGGESRATHRGLNESLWKMQSTPPLPTPAKDWYASSADNERE